MVVSINKPAISTPAATIVSLNVSKSLSQNYFSIDIIQQDNCINPR
ncbi:MAG TPA: hypothetical protein VN704_06285 [Verrucomicrobiae bacterium]|nr:hypothetical protein [Verrucomicrobiae bacterium]